MFSRPQKSLFYVGISFTGMRHVGNATTASFEGPQSVKPLVEYHFLGSKYLTERNKVSNEHVHAIGV
jgi:hypothetical protein